MIDNPYVAPLAEVAPAHASPLPGPAARVYAPKQVGAGAFFGGPLALAYLLWANFRALRRYDRARRTLAVAGIGVPLLFAAVTVLPSGIPALPLSFAYLYLGHAVATRHQLTRAAIEASDRVVPRSNWNVALVVLVSVAATMAVAIGVGMLLVITGLWNPDGTPG